MILLFKIDTLSIDLQIIIFGIDMRIWKIDSLAG